MLLHSNKRIAEVADSVPEFIRYRREGEPLVPNSPESLRIRDEKIKYLAETGQLEKIGSVPEFPVPEFPKILLPNWNFIRMRRRKVT